MVKDNRGKPVIRVTSRDLMLLDVVWSEAETNGWLVETVADLQSAIEKMSSGLPTDLLIVDKACIPGNDLNAIRALRRARPDLPLILIGDADGQERNERATFTGVDDCLIRPLTPSRLSAAIQRSLFAKSDMPETMIATEDIEPVGNDKYFTGISRSMRYLRACVSLLAGMESPVFIAGEPGSGRETVARLLHKLSVRSGFEFSRVNCGALPAELLEEEIFGWSSSDGNASARIKRGKLELCDKGMLFLDEITEIPLPLQEKLAHVLIDGQFSRIGSTKRLSVDIRIVVASSIPLTEAKSDSKIHAGFARLLDAHQLQVPSLRERKEELPILSRHFMHRLARRYSMPPREITPDINEKWQSYDWPGNLVELEQSVKRYLSAGIDQCGVGGAVCANGEGNSRIANSHLSNHPNSFFGSQSGLGECKSLRSLLRSVKEEAERNAIAKALEETGWNRKAAARLLKTSYRTVLYKIEQYQMSSSALAGSDSANDAGMSEARSSVRRRRPVSAIELSGTAEIGLSEPNPSRIG